MPFGETLVEEHLNSNNSPYKFNAKQLDEETGWYYYGARYGVYPEHSRRDPKFSIWLSVDPMAEKAPDWTPYRYGFNNPVRYTDPTGMFEDDNWIKDKETGEVKWFDAKNSEDAINKAAVHWGKGNIMTGADNPENFEDLGSSYFGPTKGNIFDQKQILDQRKSYLKSSAEKINENAGIKIDEFSFSNVNDVTYEYLSSIFLNTSFGNKQNSGSDIPGLIWGYGGSDFIESKLQKNIISKVGMMAIDTYLNTQPTGLGASKSYMDRGRAVDLFKTETIKHIDMKTIYDISRHKF